jgi:hypothetical protein
MADDYLRAARERAAERDRNRGPGIDYDAANRMFRAQKAALTRAEHTGQRDSPERRRAVTLAVRKAVKEWDAPPWNGHWPDDWARWQRALDDALPWGQRVDLRDLGDTRTRPGHPHGRGERKGIELRLTRRSGRRRYRRR